MNRIWHDNRPCDRFDPRFRRLILLVLVAVFGPGAVLIYQSYVSLGASPINGIVLALALCGGGAVTMGLEMLWVESGMPSELAFETQQLVARTRSGTLRIVPYSEITRVSSTRWKGNWSDGQYSRYVVWLKQRRLGVARALWLTPENLTILREAMRAAGMSLSGPG